VLESCVTVAWVILIKLSTLRITMMVVMILFGFG
jgi:hypothetical protein